MDEWIKLSWEGMNWRVRKGYERFIPDKIWDKGKRPEQFPECQILKDNILRTSILVPLSTKGDQKVFLKRHRRRHWKDDLKSLFIPSRAFSEWKTLLHFKRLDLPAPRPIAYGERRKQGILKDSCLITETVYSAQPLNFYVSQQFESPIKKKEALTKKIELIAQLAQLIAGLHRKGAYYRDLHGGNILCRNNPRGELELFFVDTDKVRFVSKMNPGKRIQDLAQLYNSIYFGTGAAWVRFLKTYLDEAGNVSFHWKKFFREIEKVARAFRERHIKSRNKRCLKKTTSFAVKTKRKQKN